MRKMATIRRIDAIDPIPDADAIEVATVGGWEVVVKKGEYQVGDIAVYCEIDSWIPHDLAPFLSKGQEPREYEGIRGNRLRTVKLRGQVSQGLLLSLYQVDNYNLASYIIKTQNAPLGSRFEDYIGVDVSEPLGIVKYEPPIPACLAGEVRGMFPSFVPKTDQERVQNLRENLARWQTEGDEWEVTEKLDGSSMTVYFNHGQFGVCSRNLDLRETEGNTLWQVARRYSLEKKMGSLFHMAIQGELIGEGIQKNRYGLKGQDFYVFDIYDIQHRCYLSAEQRDMICESFGLKQVPRIKSSGDLREYVDVNIMLRMAEGKSALNPNAEREGLVFKRQADDNSISFKAISNKFLMKHE